MGWDPVFGVHPHVRGCCAVVVMMLCRNQIPFFIFIFAIGHV
jgi:hypothetical protein